MSKFKSKPIIKILVLLLCLLSFGAGITLTVFACTNQSEYKENQQIVDNNEKTNQNSFGSNPFFSSMKQAKEEAVKEAEKKASDAKEQMQKYAILSAVMYFVALMMLISFIAILKGGFKFKKSRKK